MEESKWENPENLDPGLDSEAETRGLRGREDEESREAKPVGCCDRNESNEVEVEVEVKVEVKDEKAQEGKLKNVIFVKSDDDSLTN